MWTIQFTIMCTQSPFHPYYFLGLPSPCILNKLASSICLHLRISSHEHGLWSCCVRNITRSILQYSHIILSFITFDLYKKYTLLLRRCQWKLEMSEYWRHFVLKLLMASFQMMDYAVDLLLLGLEDSLKYSTHPAIAGRPLVHCGECLVHLVPKYTCSVGMSIARTAGLHAFSWVVKTLHWNDKMFIIDISICWGHYIKSKSSCKTARGIVLAGCTLSHDDRHTDTSENITFPHPSDAGGINFCTFNWNYFQQPLREISNDLLLCLSLPKWILLMNFYTINCWQEYLFITLRFSSEMDLLM